MTTAVRQPHLPGVAPADPRLDAFRQFLDAVDRKNPKLAIEMIRELRSFGISVCLTAKGGAA